MGPKRTEQQERALPRSFSPTNPTLSRTTGSYSRGSSRVQCQVNWFAAAVKHKHVWEITQQHRKAENQCCAILLPGSLLLESKPHELQATCHRQPWCIAPSWEHRLFTLYTFLEQPFCPKGAVSVLIERWQVFTERTLLIPVRGKVCENQYFVDFQLIFLCIFQKSHGINQSYGRFPSMFSFVFSPKVIPDILVTYLMVLSKHLFHFFSPYFKSYLLCQVNTHIEKALKLKLSQATIICSNS